MSELCGLRCEKLLDGAASVVGVREVGIELVEDEDGDGRLAEAAGIGWVEGSAEREGWELMGRGGLEADDALRLFVFKDGEVFFGEAGDGMAGAVGDYDVKKDETSIYAEN